MKIKLVSFTDKGAQLCERLASVLDGVGYTLPKYRKGNLKPLVNLAQWTDYAFHSCDALIFIGASGIAVRAIAPYLKSKDTDPAVLCIDETAQFVIPLLSGHIGGANQLADQIAKSIGATSVVTTATDCNNQFAVDSWAVKNDYAISDIAQIKHISSAVLDHQPVGLYSDYPVYGAPKGLVFSEQASVGIAVSLNKIHPFEHTLHLIPKCLVVGIGCRRGTAAEQIGELFEQVFDLYRLPKLGVMAVASIDVKADERGLLAFCAAHKYPFYTYSAQVLATAHGDFAPSDFVKQTVGVDNVCERAAVIASNNGRILVKKTAQNGVTISVTTKEWRVCFEDNHDRP